MIAQEELRGSWNQLSGLIREKWGQISEDELLRVEGQVDQLVGLIQEKTGQAKRTVEDALETMSQECGGVLSDVAATARQYVDQAGNRVQEGYEEAQRLVKTKPAESVAVAFGTGIIAGVVVSLLFRSR